MIQEQHMQPIMFNINRYIFSEHDFIIAPSPYSYPCVLPHTHMYAHTFVSKCMHMHMYMHTYRYISNSKSCYCCFYSHPNPVKLGYIPAQHTCLGTLNWYKQIVLGIDLHPTGGLAMPNSWIMV